MKNLLLLLSILFLPLSLIASSSCPSGKCPGAIYEKLGIPDPYSVKRCCDAEHCGKHAVVHPMSPVHMFAFCNPNGPCHLRELESQGLKPVDKPKNCVWFQGKHLVDPKNPNCCKPLPSDLNAKAKESPIYKRAHGLPIITPLAWLYPTPNDADRGRKPLGAGTIITNNYCPPRGLGHPGIFIRVW